MSPLTPLKHYRQSLLLRRLKLSLIGKAAEEEQSPTAAELVAELGITADGVLKRQAFHQAVLKFLQAMQAELARHPRVAWDAQAANTFVGTVLGSLRKNQFNTLLMDLESQGIPSPAQNFY